MLDREQWGVSVIGDELGEMFRLSRHVQALEILPVEEEN
jgi:hypothetical protein